MFTTLAYSESLATTAAYQKIAAVPDNSIKVAGDSIYVSSFNRYVGAMACIQTNGLSARLTSPSIRRIAPIHIQPVTLGLIPGANLAYDVTISKNIVLEIDEQLEVEFYGTAVGAAQVSVVVWLADAEIKPVSGEIFSIMATTTITLAAGVWVSGALTFDDDLPVGSYDVVGMDVVSSTSVAARLIPIGGTNRPGVPCRQLASGVDPNGMFRNGNMGVFCTFPHNNIPNIEVLCSAATGAQTMNVILDLIKK
ncbi:MAG: hypothetical protein PHI02_09330 [Sulfurovaceae bacterium]|nr:hypothetical protein [Sulfurovaceae bacterium]